MKKGVWTLERLGGMFLLAGGLILSAPASAGGQEEVGAFQVDKDKRLLRIPARIAPRKINDPRYKQIYPIEVIACWPFPKGQKAHETVVTVDVLPSRVHQALVELGLKPGRPILGESTTPPQGPECKIYLELPEAGGVRRVTLDKALIDKRTGKSFPKSVTWRFTGSVMTKPDPNSDKVVYGADLTGTLITIFPVTDQTVFQTNLTLKYEHLLQLETNSRLLPPEGTPVQLVIEAPPAR